MKRLFLATLFLLFGLTIFSRTIQEEPLFLELLAIDYGTYTEESEYAFVLEGDSAYQNASLTYGQDYVEYALEKDDHEMKFFLTEQGSIYSFDGRVLDITKANKDNILFAQYLEELQLLLLDKQDLFKEVTTTTYSGKGDLEEVPLTWTICYQTDGSMARISYTYSFLQGSTFTYSGTIPKAELKGAKSLLTAANLDAFCLD